MERFKGFDQTPHIRRERRIEEGRWIDITGHLLGHRARSGIVNIACSFEFMTRVLHGSFTPERIKMLTAHLKECEFTMKRGKEEFKCQCIRTVEQFRGQQTICFTFFEGK